MNQNPVPCDRREAIKRLGIVASGASMLTVAGCTQMLAGTSRLLWGEPKLPAEFTTLTKVDLSKGLKKVLVICSTPEAIDTDVSTLRLDIVDGVTRQMELNGVKVIKPDLVADWMDSHGSGSMDPQEIAQEFETDYIAWIDVQSFDLREPNSPKLLRGHTSGYIRVFKVEGEGEQRRALKVYQREFALTYPQHQPISEQGKSSIVFHKEYVLRVCSLLAERFYDHRVGNSF